MDKFNPNKMERTWLVLKTQFRWAKKQKKVKTNNLKKS